MEDVIGKFFPMWATISSLSLKIFKQFFLSSYVVGVSDQEVYKVFKNAYFGGFTQAFWIGENLPDDDIVYLDFNSMYPYIMAYLLLPTNFSYCNYKDLKLQPILIQGLE